MPDNSDETTRADSGEPGAGAPTPTRERLLAMLRAREPVNLNQVIDAVDTGTITDDEVRELLPGWDALEAAAKAATAGASMAKLGLDLAAIAKARSSWQQQLGEIAGPLLAARAALDSQAIVAPISPNPQLTVLGDVHAELVNVAKILMATGEQIASMASLAAGTVAGLDSVHRETTALRQDLRAGHASADKSARTITWLTWALVGFGFVTVLLTGAVVWLTYVLLQKH